MTMHTVVFERDGRDPLIVKIPDTDGNPNHLSPDEIDAARAEALRQLPVGSDLDLFTMVMQGPQVTQVGVPADGTATASHVRVVRFLDTARPGILPDEQPREIPFAELVRDPGTAGALVMIRVDNELIGTQSLAAGASALIKLPAGLANGSHEVSLEVVDESGASVVQFNRTITVSGEDSEAVQPAPRMPLTSRDVLRMRDIRDDFGPVPPRF
jgi:hypothetical protein